MAIRPSKKRPSPSDMRETTSAESATGESSETQQINGSRNQRARLKTRKRLIEAAYRAMARKGVENTTINEITEEADVAFGSFYNHFKSKEEIAHAVFTEYSSEMALHFSSLNEGVTDPALILSRNYRRIARRTREDPEWGWFIVHANFALRDVREMFWSRMVANLEQGLSEGRYKLKGIVTAGDIAFGALVAILRSILEGNATPAAEIEMVELLLRMLGIPHDEAERLARDPLPEKASSSALHTETRKQLL